MLRQGLPGLLVMGKNLEVSVVNSVTSKKLEAQRKGKI